jgi:CRISPR-associated Csx2 family protein
MARVLVTFLGTGDYAQTVYALDGRRADPTRFVQVAIVSLLGGASLGRVVIFRTQRSHEQHYEALRAELIAAGVEASAIVAPDTLIPTEMTAANQWGWFESLLASIDDYDEVTFDFTYGPRPVPIVFSSAIGFLVRAKNVHIEHAYYGWFDRSHEVNPIVDMRDFYAINDWADAVGRLTDDADARKLASLAQRADVPGLSGLGAPELVTAFQRMTDCIRNVDVNNISKLVSDALEKVRFHRASSSGASAVLLDCVWDKFRALSSEAPATGHYDADYFRVQLEIIGVLLEHRLFMQAFTAMRELIGSIGMAGLEGKYARDMVSSDGRRYRHRHAELFVNMIQFDQADWQFAEPYQHDLTRLRPWYEQLQGLGVIASLRSVAGKGVGRLLDYRNGFDHAWTANRGGPADVEGLGTSYLTTLSQVVEQVAAALASKPDDEPARRSGSPG